MSVHLTAVLLVPLAVGAAWPKDLTRDLRGLRKLCLRAGAGFSGSMLGLVPFLTLAIGAGGAWRWGDTRSLPGLLHHVLRVDYGVFALSLHRKEISPEQPLLRSMSRVAEELSVGLFASPGPALVLLLAILLFARRPPPLPRPAWWGLLGSIATTSVLFPLRQNLDPSSPFAAWILERFDLLPLMLWALLLTLALERLHDKLTTPLAPRLLGAAAVAAVCLQLSRTYVAGGASQEAGIQRYAEDVLLTPPPGTRAIIFGTDDHRTFPILYAQSVQGAGEGILYLDASLMSHSWYRAQARRRFAQLPEVDKPVRMMHALWNQLGAEAPPIYLANIFSRPARSLDLVPEGLLWRVVPPDGRSDPSYSLGAIVERHLAAMARYKGQRRDFAGLHSPRSHPWSADLWWAYSDGSRRLLRVLHQQSEAPAIAQVQELLERFDPPAPAP